MAEAEKPQITEFGLLGLLALLWGSSYYFAKIALVDLPTHDTDGIPCRYRRCFPTNCNADCR
jgi:hypothetical protein